MRIPCKTLTLIVLPTLLTAVACKKTAVTILMSFRQAKQAIEYARTWDVEKFNPAMEHDLEGGLGCSLLMSCAANKWDGDNPPQQRRAACSAMIGSSGLLTRTPGG